MFPSALAIPAPLPFVFDLTLTFGPVLLLAVLAVLDLSTVAVLHAALVARHGRKGSDAAMQPSLLPARLGGSEKAQAAPPSRAA
jgi:hypothetical protein